MIAFNIQEIIFMNPLQTIEPDIPKTLGFPNSIFETFMAKERGHKAKATLLKFSEYTSRIHSIHVVGR